MRIVSQVRGLWCGVKKWWLSLATSGSPLKLLAALLIGLAGIIVAATIMVKVMWAIGFKLLIAIGILIVVVIVLVLVFVLYLLFVGAAHAFKKEPPPTP